MLPCGGAAGAGALKKSKSLKASSAVKMTGACAGGGGGEEEDECAWGGGGGKLGRGEAGARGGVSLLPKDAHSVENT